MTCFVPLPLCRLSIPFLLGCGPASQAFELDQIATHYEAGEYRLSMTATLAAPLHRVEDALRDYAHYPELDTRILEARVTTPPILGALQLFTRIRVCVSFVCRNVDRVEQVQERPGEIVATVIADRSDAVRGETHTVLVAQGAFTQVRYTTFIVPKFWIPAWLGRALMLRTLRDGTINLFQHIEQRAAIVSLGPAPLHLSVRSEAASDHAAAAPFGGPDINGSLQPNDARPK